MKLLLTQKNDLFNTIPYGGFSPAQFQYVEEPSSPVRASATRIVYQAHSEYNFMIFPPARGSAAYSITYVPGMDAYSEKSNCSDWGIVMLIFRNWLEWLKREIGVEDKWARLEAMTKEVTSFEAPNSADNFSIQEYKLLQEKMYQLKEGVETLALSAPQSEALNNKLDRLLENAETMRKGEWQNLFIGTVISFILEQGLEQVDIHALWQLIKQVFSGVLLLTV